MVLESPVTAIVYFVIFESLLCLIFQDFTADLMLSQDFLAKPFPKQFPKRRSTNCVIIRITTYNRILLFV